MPGRRTRDTEPEMLVRRALTAKGSATGYIEGRGLGLSHPRGRAGPPFPRGQGSLASAIRADSLPIHTESSMASRKWMPSQIRAWKASQDSASSDV
jgi:hypothetical protein